MRRRRSIVVVACGLMVVIGVAQTPLRAHHSFAAEFSADKPIKLRGTVTKMEWVNPHCWIHIDVKTPDGQVESWRVEGGTPNTLLRRGFTKNSLLSGTEVIIDGYQAKNGSRTVGGRDVTFTDGRKLFLVLGSSGTGAPQDGRDPTER